MTMSDANPLQGDPTEWVSSHRFHHLHTDTPLDPHSPYEGFWWSHMGWLLDEKACMRCHVWSAEHVTDHCNRAICSVAEAAAPAFASFMCRHVEGSSFYLRKR